MDLRNFLKDQIEKGKINWESRSELIRSAGEKVNGHTNRVLKEYENKFRFGSLIEIKNKAIKNYFDKQAKNTPISVEGVVNVINQDLPKEQKDNPNLFKTNYFKKTFYGNFEQLINGNFAKLKIWHY